MTAIQRTLLDNPTPPTCLHILGQDLVNALHAEGRECKSKACIWQPATEPPDDETTVLIALSDGEVWTGFRLAGEWRFVCGELVDQGDGTTVTYWADFPEPPEGI